MIYTIRGYDCHSIDSHYQLGEPSDLLTIKTIKENDINTMRGETNILATNRTELFSNKPIPAIILEKKEKYIGNYHFLRKASVHI